MAQTFFPKIFLGSFVKMKKKMKYVLKSSHLSMAQGGFHMIQNEKKHRRYKKREKIEVKNLKKKSSNHSQNWFNYFSSASSNREDPDPGGGEGVREGLVHPYPW